ncbi:MAG: HAD family hydrolase [Aestuariivirga sp.]
MVADKPRLTTVGLDADDTLWQSEQFFKLTEARFVELLAGYAEGADLSARLLQAEMKNLQFYGFGTKSFVLSMIETAIDVTHGQVPAPIIQEILSAGREMLTHPILPLPHVRETLEELGRSLRLVLITKGDLFDQERKLAQSGLGELFDGIEIVTDKTPQTYKRIFDRHGEGPERAVMVGNSLKSDIVPAITAGCWGVFIPHELTWTLEHVEAPTHHPRFKQLNGFSELHEFIAKIS